MVSGYSSCTITRWVTGIEASLRKAYLRKLKRSKIDDWTYFLITTRDWYPQILHLSTKEGYRWTQLQRNYLEIFLLTVHWDREAWIVRDRRWCVSSRLVALIKPNYWQGKWIFETRPCLHPERWTSQYSRVCIGWTQFECNSDSKLETNRAASFPNIVSWLYSGPGGDMIFLTCSIFCALSGLFTNNLQVKSSCSQKGTTEAITRSARIATSTQTPWIIARKVQIFHQSANSILKRADHSQVFIYRYVLVPLFLIPLLSVWIGYTFKTIPSK